MVGERLLDLRLDAGLKQEELARILNTTKYSISAYEREINEPSDTMKIRIAKLFHVSIDYLLGVTDDPTPYSDRRVLWLPPGLSDEARASLSDYVSFLKTKYDEKKIDNSKK